MTDIQHVNVKIFAQPPVSFHWADLVPIFHRWIREKLLPETMIDVADYVHVPAGPGMMMIGHEAFYSVDNRQNQPGMLYNRRTPTEGSLAEKLGQAYDGAVRAARALEQEPSLGGKLHFNEAECEVFINDRLLAPNTEETWSALRPQLESFFATRFGRSPQLQWNGASRELFRVRVRS